MTERPFVSVITPVRNGERFLAEALESLFAQDYEPFESIVVDDGSTDRSGAIARSFPRVRYVRQTRAGAATARNVALRLARGELVAFLDADDVLLPRKLSLQAQRLVERPDLAGVLARQELLVEGDVPEFRRDPLFDDPGGIPIVSLMVRRSVLEELGGFDPSYAVSEDRDLLVRLKERGHAVEVLPDVVLRRRFHGGNQTFAGSSLILRSLKEKLDRERAGEPAA